MQKIPLHNLRRKAFLLPVLLALVIGGFSTLFSLRADTLILFPEQCKGAWRNIEHITSQESISEDTKFTKENSAYLNKEASEILCTDFDTAHIPEEIINESISVFVSHNVVGEFIGVSEDDEDFEIKESEDQKIEEELFENDKEAYLLDGDISEDSFEGDLEPSEKLVEEKAKEFKKILEEKKSESYSKEIKKQGIVVNGQDFLDVVYSFDGDSWYTLGSLGFENVGYNEFAIPLTTLDSYRDLNSLTIALSPKPNFDFPDRVFVGNFGVSFEYDKQDSENLEIIETDLNLLDGLSGEDPVENLTQLTFNSVKLLDVELDPETSLNEKGHLKKELVYAQLLKSKTNQEDIDTLVASTLVDNFSEDLSESFADNATYQKRASKYSGESVGTKDLEKWIKKELGRDGVVREYIVSITQNELKDIIEPHLAKTRNELIVMTVSQMMNTSNREIIAQDIESVLFESTTQISDETKEYLKTSLSRDEKLYGLYEKTLEKKNIESKKSNESNGGGDDKKDSSLNGDTKEDSGVVEEVNDQEEILNEKTDSDEVEMEDESDEEVEEIFETESEQAEESPETEKESETETKKESEPESEKESQEEVGDQTQALINLFAKKVFAQGLEGEEASQEEVLDELLDEEVLTEEVGEVAEEIAEEVEEIVETGSDETETEEVQDSTNEITENVEDMEVEESVEGLESDEEAEEELVDLDAYAESVFFEDEDEDVSLEEDDVDVSENIDMENSESSGDSEENEENFEEENIFNEFINDDIFNLDFGGEEFDLPEITTKDVEAPLFQISLRNLLTEEIVVLSEDDYHFENGSVVLVVEPQFVLDPGNYSVLVEIYNPFTGQVESLEQDFTWGVLAFNTDKDWYLPNEIADVHIGVLNDFGYIICDADVLLHVDTPSKERESYSVESTESCGVKNASNTNPDYKIDYLFEEVGNYTFSVEATTDNGTKTISQNISVSASPVDLVRVTRKTLTRVWPLAWVDSNIEVEFFGDYAGVVREVAPKDFIIIDATGGPEILEIDGKQIIEWSGSWVSGETATFSYRYDAPDISPYFYTLGPLQGEDTRFLEDRLWMIANDTPGDMSIAREATAGQTITTGGVTLSWDTTVTASGNIPVGATTLTLSEGGHYLLMYNVGFQETGTNNRREVNTFMQINGGSIPYGTSTCYIRSATGTNECWLHGAAVVNVSAGDTYSVFAQRTDSNGSTMANLANESGITAIKLNDNWDFLRIYEAGGGQTINSTTPTGIDFDTQDEVDSGSFSHSGTSVTLKQTGHYLVSYNVKYNNSSGTLRHAVQTRMTNNGVEIPGSRTTAYLRGTNSTQDHSDTFIGIIETTDVNQVLEVQGACDGLVCTSLSNVGNETAFTVVKLPDSVDYIRLTGNDSTQTVDSTNTPITWGQQDEVDADFTHTGGAAPITVNTAADYLFLSGFYSDRTGSTSTNRHYPHWEWRLNGAGKINYGSFGKYNRGNQGTTGVYSSGASGALAVNGLSATDTIQLISTDESTGTDALDVYKSGQFAVQGVNLTDLFTSQSNTRQTHFRWRDDSTTLNSGTGWIDTEDVDLSNAVNQDMSLNQNYRLRIAVANEGDGAEVAGRQYELEYGLKTTTCQAIATWTGVADAGDAFDMGASTQFTEADATTAVLANTEGYTFVAGEGRETADTSAAIGPLAVDNYTELEYSFQATTSATSGGVYCFRVYDSFGASEIDSYGIYPEAKIADPVTTQLHYRWRDDSSFLNTDAGWLAALDTDPSTATNKTDAYRLRFEVATTGTGGELAARTYELQFADREGVASCDQITAWTGVSDTDGDAIDIKLTAVYVEGDSTTGVFPNTEAYTFVTGYAYEVADTTAAIGPMAQGNYTELEYRIEVTESAVTGHSYCLRLYDTANATDLDSYSVYPELRVAYVSLPTGPLGEAGVVTVAADAAWTTINFENTYTTPVVVGQTITENDNGALIFEARNVGATSAEVRVCDTNATVGGGCENHLAEDASYIVIDADTTDDYPDIEAGTASRSGSGQSNVTYPGETFGATPYVFANVQDGGSVVDGIETRVNAVGTGTFGLSVCQQSGIDTCNAAAAAQSVGWIAINPNGVPALNVTHNDNTLTLVNSFVNPITFATAFSNIPALVVEVVTHATTNNTLLDRALNVTTTTADIGYCEQELEDSCGGNGNETTRSFAVEQGPYGQVSLDQTNYRFYDDTNNITPTTPLSDENTTAVIASGSNARLRIAAQVGIADWAASVLDLKLQYGQKVSSCDAIGAWTDLDTSGGGGVWRYENNGGGLTDEDAIPSTLLTPSDIAQTYQEITDITAPNTATRGQHMEFDIAITNNGAAAATNWCFRLVTAADDTIVYTRYAEAQTAPDAPGGVFSGLTFWLRADDGPDNTTDGGTITSWVDKGTNGNDFTGTNTPTYESDSDSLLNNNPIVRLDDGDDDQFEIVGTARANDETIYIVGTFPDDAGANAWYDSESTFLSRSFLESTPGFPVPTMYQTTNLPFATDRTGIPLMHSATWLLAGNDTSRVNGGEESVTGDGDGGAAPGTGFRIGCLGQIADLICGAGDIAEVVLYDSDLSTADENLVESYLAIKYGITLGQSGTGQNYVDSGSNIIFDADTAGVGSGDLNGYANDIAGIGVDDNSALNQVKSTSINSDATVTMWNASSLGNGDFLVWGNDDGSSGITATGAPTSYPDRVNRIWRVDETNDVGTVIVEFDLSAAGVTNTGQVEDYALLIDTDVDFSDGTVHTSGRSLNGNIITFSLVDFADLNYFTLGYNAPGITFSISDNTIGFGPLNSSSVRYATGDTLGSAGSSTAHTISVTTDADNGYTLYVEGNTLTSPATDTISAIGGTAAASVPGTEQFGFNVSAVGGSGAVSAPYNTANYAYDGHTAKDIVATATTGDDVLTTYSFEYISNVAALTESGEYETYITYTILPNF